ncbi:hypothetical protein BaRGS_00005002 [Batillaria attramentaria]|uniref:Uncharacterized protein n=1 Tax=Batillaria attramentaria TaxID=370345 RepID=A0ABD0LW80_9CAEN
MRRRESRDIHNVLWTYASKAGNSKNSHRWESMALCRSTRVRTQEMEGTPRSAARRVAAPWSQSTGNAENLKTGILEAW